MTIYTDPEKFEEWLEKAREAYQARNVRLADMVDESVDEFYSCTLCQSFAPNHVCVVSPERLGLCGAYNWLDCKASYQINPTGPNQPIPKGICLDPTYGVWQGSNEFVYQNSHQAVERVTIYSIMQDPMTACGCFECIADGDPRGQRRHGGLARGSEHDPGGDDLLHAGRRGRRRAADAGHDGHGQVLSAQQASSSRRTAVSSASCGCPAT